MTTVDMLRGHIEYLREDIERRRSSAERAEAEAVALRQRVAEDEVRLAEAMTAANILENQGLKAWRDDETGLVNVSVEP